MSLTLLLPIIATAASTGLGCGVTCGACGSPMTNVFLASYLFTHTGRLKKSILSFIHFYLGKIFAVVMLCVLASWAGSKIVDEDGMIFGLQLSIIVQAMMFVFSVILIVRWVQRYKGEGKNAGCSGCKGPKQSKLPMLVCGFISGVSPCSPLILAIGYSASLSILEAAVIGVVFSIASSILPLVLLVILTGLLSDAMFKEIPGKIKYFQLGAYAVFAIVSGITLIQYI